MKKILLYLWQLPQNLIGAALTLFYKPTAFIPNNGIMERYCPGFPGGISLGDYIFVGSTNPNMVKHEYGHHVQSLYLGWLYLIIIGIPSITWATLYGPIIKETKNGYYKFYTERWADKLGGVER